MTFYIILAIICRKLCLYVALPIEPTKTKNFVRPDIAEICLKKPRFKYTTFMKDLALCMLLTV